MARDPRYDILFEPVKIGPVTTPNRFYQVPHCTGNGWLRPQMLADMRAMKAEGGWGVVNTEYCSIHPSSDDLPYPYASLWDDGDIKAQSLMTEKVHSHGSLAGVELWIGGSRPANHQSRLVPMDVTSRNNQAGNPWQTRAVDKEDIRNIRRWHRLAALRAKQAGFDIVYVYAAHRYFLASFLNKDLNTRTDEYGGSLENRVRLVRELLEETKEAVGDTCAVACRFAADAGGGKDGEPIVGEQADMIAMLAEIPDLWDLVVDDYSLEMGVSRFVPEGSLEPYVKYVKSLTTKPVVSVGRFTSPDTMVSQIKRGVLDLIGAARPSIADPFLPKKIEEGRLEDIRECIGCNFCYSGDANSISIPCTQNPTMNEEWRLGWHPEKIEPKGSDSHVLVVGAGPAGLEAARALGQRGYQVTLAEASRELGGRVVREAALPGLSAWIRVRDYREQQIKKMTNVEVFLESKLGVADIVEVGADHVVIATGAHWRRTGVGYANETPAQLDAPEDRVFTPDDLMAGRLPEGRVAVYDDDHYYMASVLADLLLAQGREVVFVTAGRCVAQWGSNTVEQIRSQRSLIAAGVEIVAEHTLAGFDGARASVVCNYSGKSRDIQADSLLLVTSREPDDALYRDLCGAKEAGEAGGIKSVTRIGDCDAPGIIGLATRAGHRYARELDAAIDADVPMKHDRVFGAS